MVISYRIKTDITSTNVLYFPIIVKENVCSISLLFSGCVRVKLMDYKQEHNLVGKTKIKICYYLKILVHQEQCISHLKYTLAFAF